jgi:hypothetical protein
MVRGDDVQVERVGVVWDGPLEVGHARLSAPATFHQLAKPGRLRVAGGRPHPDLCAIVWRAKARRLGGRNCLHQFIAAQLIE